MAILYRWLGGEGDFADVIRNHKSDEFASFVIETLRREKEISRRELLGILVKKYSKKYTYSTIESGYLGGCIKSLFNKGAIEMERGFSEQRRLAERCGLTKKQIRDYRYWMSDAGVLGNEKGYRGPYSLLEKRIFYRIGEYMNGGRRVGAFEAIRWSVEETLGEESQRQFENWRREYRKRQSRAERERLKRGRKRRKIELIKSGFFVSRLTDEYLDAMLGVYDDSLYRLEGRDNNLVSRMHDSLLEKLVEKFFEYRGNMINTFPLNLFFALSNINPYNFVRGRIDRAMRSLRKGTFEEYKAGVFNYLEYVLEDIAARTYDPFEIALNPQSQINNSISRGLKRYLEVIGSRYYLEGKTVPQREIAKKYGISRWFLCNMEERVLEYLRNVGRIRDVLSTAARI